MKTSILQNNNENIVRISTLKAFIASLGLPVGFFILIKSFQEALRKLQNFQGRNPYNIFVAILV